MCAWDRFNFPDRGSFQFLVCALFLFVTSIISNAYVILYYRNLHNSYVTANEVSKDSIELVDSLAPTTNLQTIAEARRVSVVTDCVGVFGPDRPDFVTEFIDYSFLQIRELSVWKWLFMPYRLYVTKNLLNC